MRQGRCLPAAAQRFVHGNQACCRLGAALGELILGRKLRPLGIEHFQKADHSTFVARPRNLRRGHARSRFMLDLRELVARASVSDQGVLGFLERAQNRLLIQGERLIVARMRLIDARPNATEIEGCPRDGRPDHVLPGAALAERTK